MQQWLKELEYNKKDEKPDPPKEYFCCYPKFKYTETCMMCGETFYTSFEIVKTGGLVKQICDENECLNKFNELYRWDICPVCIRQSVSIHEDYTKEQVYEEYTKEEWNKKVDETIDFCPLCGRTYDYIRNCVICGKQFKTNRRSASICRNKQCRNKYPTWKKNQKRNKNKKTKPPICKFEGCNNFVFNKNQEFCFEHYKKAQNIAYADDISVALKHWLEYEGFDIIAKESLGFDVSACRKKEYPTGEIIGIEIKSDHDSYERLPEQLPKYLDVFDKVYLCIDKKKPPYHPSVGILRYKNGYITVEKEAPTYIKKDNFSRYNIQQILSLSGLSPFDAEKTMHTFDLFRNIQRKITYISLFKNNHDFINDKIKISGTESHFLKHLVKF